VVELSRVEIEVLSWWGGSLRRPARYAVNLGILSELST
jgi:hypothetical protein